MKTLKCSKCSKKMKEAIVDVEGTKNKFVGYQCDSGHVEFEKESAAKVVKELKTKETHEK